MKRNDKAEANQILTGAKKVTSLSPSQFRKHGPILPADVAGAQFLRIKRLSNKPHRREVFATERMLRGTKVNRATTLRG